MFRKLTGSISEFVNRWLRAPHPPGQHIGSDSTFAGKNDALLEYAGSVNHFVRAPGPQVLFLDFDGVLHPGTSETFAYRDLFEASVSQYSIDIVISSDWRISCTFDYLLSCFSASIAARIAGCTPLCDSEHSRYDEIMDVVNRYSIRNWLAVDDTPSLYPPGLQELTASR